MHTPAIHVRRPCDQLAGSRDITVPHSRPSPPAPRSAVGAALKAVDVSLLADWATWSADAFPPSRCAQAWAKFEPVVTEHEMEDVRRRDAFLAVRAARHPLSPPRSATPLIALADVVDDPHTRAQLLRRRRIDLLGAVREHLARKWDRRTRKGALDELYRDNPVRDAGQPCRPGALALTPGAAQSASEREINELCAARCESDIRDERIGLDYDDFCAILDKLAITMPPQDSKLLFYTFDRGVNTIAVRMHRRAHCAPSSSHQVRLHAFGASHAARGPAAAAAASCDRRTWRRFAGARRSWRRRLRARSPPAGPSSWASVSVRGRTGALPCPR